MLSYKPPGPTRQLPRAQVFAGANGATDTGTARLAQGWEEQFLERVNL